MFDFFKALIPVAMQHNLRENQKLKWEKTFDFNDKVKEEICKFSDLTFIQKDRICILQGSIHKLHNELIAHTGLQNYDSFTFNKLVDSCNLITKEFGISPYQLQLQNIEFGVNIISPLNINQFLNAVIAHNKKLPDEVKRFREKGYLIKFEHQRYLVKIYDKGKQYKQPGNILRIECHVNKMIHLENHGIRFLSDLLDFSKIANLSAYLTNIVDNLQLDTDVYGLQNLILSKPQSNLIKQLGSRKQIEIMMEADKKKLNSLNRNFQKFLETEKHTDIKVQLRKSIEEKWTELTSIDDKTRTKLTAYLSQFPEFNKNKNQDHFNHSHKGLNQPLEILYTESENQVIQSSSNICQENLGISHPKKFCLTCKRDISHQIASSKYCSEWRNGKDGKKCRDRGNSVRSSARKAILKRITSPSLFNQLDLIKEEIIEKAEWRLFKF